MNPINKARKAEPQSNKPLGFVAWRFPLTVAAAYGLIGGLWILFSDRVVAEIADTKAAETALQTYKGWGFVLVTAILLALVLHSAWRKLLEGKAELEENRDRLELALSNAGGGVWDRDLTRNLLHISPQLADVVGLRVHRIERPEEWIERIHSDDRKAVHDSIRRAISGDDSTLHDARYRIRHEDGHFRWIHSRARIIRDANRAPLRMIGVCLDVTEQATAGERIERLARHDALTGLPNRRAFLEHLDEALGADKPKSRLFVIRIDIDRFREVNEEFGSAHGDSVLVSICNRLRKAAGHEAFLARMGSDEFALAIPEFASPRSAEAAVRALLDAFDAPFTLRERDLRLSASVGIAIAPDDGGSTDAILKNADVALAHAREDGGGKLRFFAEGMDEAFRLKARRGQDLRGAVGRRELEIHYQPVIGLTENRTVGFEALVRWNRPGEGKVPPDQFIGLAEELGLIAEIGQEVLRQACMLASEWKGNGLPPPYLAVNVSPRQFDDPGFIESVWNIVKAANFPPSRLELEVTETALSRNPKVAKERLHSLRALGISVAIDDFGTGYSSLGALESLPLSRLKIDKSFVARYAGRERNTVIVDSILGLARSLDLPVTAEGVETPGQLELLRDKGAEAAQGYLFSRPVPQAMVDALIAMDWKAGAG